VQEEETEPEMAATATTRLFNLDRLDDLEHTDALRELASNPDEFDV
jgi:hypothetical protein